MRVELFSRFFLGVPDNYWKIDNYLYNAENLLESGYFPGYRNTEPVIFETRGWHNITSQILYVVKTWEHEDEPGVFILYKREYYMIMKPNHPNEIFIIINQVGAEIEETDFTGYDFYFLKVPLLEDVLATTRNPLESLEEEPVMQLNQSEVMNRLRTNNFIIRSIDIITGETWNRLQSRYVGTYLQLLKESYILID